MCKSARLLAGLANPVVKLACFFPLYTSALLSHPLFSFLSFIRNALLCDHSPCPIPPSACIRCSRRKSCTSSCRYCSPAPSRLRRATDILRYYRRPVCTFALPTLSLADYIFAVRLVDTAMVQMTL